jgi:hypothetical protein
MCTGTECLTGLSRRSTVGIIEHEQRRKLATIKSTVEIRNVCVYAGVQNSDISSDGKGTLQLDTV